MERYARQFRCTDQPLKWPIHRLTRKCQPVKFGQMASSHGAGACLIPNVMTAMHVRPDSLLCVAQYSLFADRKLAETAN